MIDGQPAPSFLARFSSAFRNRNYRYYFAGSALLYAGFWMQVVAVGWLAYALSGSKTILGTVSALETLPSLFFSFYAGTIADRLDRKLLVNVTQMIFALQALALTLLYYSHRVTLESLFVLAAIGGIADAFYIPARSALVVDVVGPELLLNANALGSMIFNGARIVGPVVAGILIARFGEGAAFLANGLACAMAALTMLRIQMVQRSAADQTRTSVVADMRAGLAYLATHPFLARLAAAMAVYSIFGMNYIVLMPAFTRDIFHGDARVLGWLFAAMGLGALVSAVLVAGSKGRPTWAALFCTALALPLSQTAFAYAGDLRAALPLLALVGFSVVAYWIRMNTLVQMSTDEVMLGRVMGIYTTIFLGLGPLGSLLAGAIADRFGAPFAIASGCAVCVAAGAWLFLAMRAPLLAHAARG
ncbi:MAG: MFS transporter [bacterium]|nr:MFS transporter [bacterium]